MKNRKKYANRYRVNIVIDRKLWSDFTELTENEPDRYLNKSSVIEDLVKALMEGQIEYSRNAKIVQNIESDNE